MSRAPRRGRRLRARPPGRVGARLGRRDRQADHPGRHLAGQALAGDPRPARGATGAAETVNERSGMPLDPYFSAGKLAWLLEHDDAVAAAPRRRHAAPRHRRLVPLRPPRRRLRDRPLDRVAHPAAAGGPTGTPSCWRSSASRRTRCRRSRTPPATSASCATDRGPPSFRCAPAAPTSRRRSRAPVRRARADQGDLRDRRVRPRPRRRRAARGRRRPAADRGLAGRRQGRVRARRRRLHGGRAARVDERATSASPRTRRRSPRSPPRSRTPTASGSCRRSPAWARRGGAPTPARSSPGMSAGTRPAHIARAALEAIAWRVADVLAVIARGVAGRGAARRRRAHERPAAAPAPGRRRRSRRRARRGRRDGRRIRRAGGRRRRALGLDPRDRRAHPGRRARRRRSATTRGASASTPSGGASWSAPQRL